MGMVNQSEEMQREISRILLKAGATQLISEKINASTDLSVCVCPLCYDVVLNEKKIASFNCPENAVTVYRAMLADLKGEIYHG